MRISDNIYIEWRDWTWYRTKRGWVCSHWNSTHEYTVTVLGCKFIYVKG